MTKRSKILVGLLLAVIALTACGKKDKQEQVEGEKIPVSIEKIELTEVPQVFEFTGKVSSQQQATLSTRLMGHIVDVLVKEGDAVKKGDLLVKIRNNDILAKQQQVEASIAGATAGYKSASADFERVSTLYNQNSATKKELDDITAHKEMSKARLSAAEKMKAEVNEMMRYASIRAPFNGTITQKFVYAGDMANPGMPLVAIEAPGQFEVVTRIPESDVLKCEVGDKVKVTIKSAGITIDGEITKVSPSNKYTGAQYETIIYLHPSEANLALIRSGMFANVQLQKGSEKAVMVPQELVVERGQLTGIWTVTASNQALLRWVRLGRSVNGMVEVLSGLTGGEIIIVSNQGRLVDGKMVASK